MRQMTPDHVKHALNRGSEDVTAERVIQFETDVNIDAVRHLCGHPVTYQNGGQYGCRDHTARERSSAAVGQPFGNALREMPEIPPILAPVLAEIVGSRFASDPVPPPFTLRLWTAFHHAASPG